MADIKISELEPTTDLEGLYTIGSDKNNLSKKVSLQFLKDAANYANEQGDYAKEVGDTVNGNVGVNDYPAFSASASYSAGDIVRYNGTLYQFTANHAASAWNGNDVKATSINAITSGKLTELESEIYTIFPSTNLFNKSDYVQGYYGEDGVNFIATQSFYTTGFMPVESGVTYTRQLDASLYVYAYDANRNPVVISNGKPLWTGNTKNITIPSGVAYVKALFKPANLNTFMYCKQSEYPSTYSPYAPRKEAKIPQLEQSQASQSAAIQQNSASIAKNTNKIASNSGKIEKLNGIDQAFGESVNLFNKEDYVKGYYVNDGITYSEHPTIWTTGFMPVQVGVSYTRSASPSYYVYAYDSNRNPIAVDGGNPFWTGNTRNIIMPSGVAYVRVCFGADLLDSFMYCRTDKAPSSYKPYMPILKEDALPILKEDVRRVKAIRIFRRVGCIGDSYTAGFIQVGDVRSPKNEDYAWPHYMEVLTGTKYDNFGVTGSSVKSWITNSNNLAPVKAQGNKCQAYIIGLMINDRVSSNANYVALGTSADIGTDADSYYAYYYKLINELFSVNSEAYIILTTCPMFDANFGYNVAVREIVAYCKNQGKKVYLADLAADKYKLSPNYYANPIMTTDYINSHYSAIGYEFFAECYLDILSELIEDNYADFQSTAFIPYDK